MSSRPSTARGRAGADAGGGDGVNVQVILRCRPVNENEVASRAQKVIDCNDDRKEVTVWQSMAGKRVEKTFRFDKVFGPSSGQEDIFHTSIAPIVQEVLEGFNCTIFAYGQTGTGKTYTMEGDFRGEGSGSAHLPAGAGVIPRAINLVFQTLEGMGSEYTVKVSYLELYNEEITDLLAAGEDDAGRRLRLMEDASNVVHVGGLEEIIVSTPGEIHAVLDRGSYRRTKGATLLNKQSSRSHSVFTITIHMKESTPEGEEIIKVGKLNLVDLAGSENISKSGAKDQRAREAGSINQSLLCLGRVITALTERQPYVPYRDSKLTRLLRESLGGRAKTCIVATIAPTVTCLDETVNTLDYAHRAKNIRNRPEINQKISKTALLKDYAGEIDKLKAQLYSAREKEGVYLPTDQYTAMEERIATQERDLAAAQEALGVQAEAARAAEGALAAERAAHGALRAKHAAAVAALERTAANLKQAQLKIEEQEHVIAVQREAEAALAAHAVGLTHELERTAAELGAAHAKIERKAGVERDNAATVGALAAEAQRAVGGMAAALGRAVEAQRAAHGAVASGAAAALERRRAELQSSQASLEALSGTLAGLRDAGAASLSGLADGARSALSDAAASQERHRDAVVKALADAERACADGIAEVRAALSGERGRVRAVADAQTAAAEELRAHMERLVASAEAAMKGVSDASARARADGAARVAAQQECLRAVAAEFRARAEREKEEMVKRMAAVVGDFVGASVESVTAVTAKVAEDVGAGGVSLQSDMDAVAAAAREGAGLARGVGVKAGEEVAEAAAKARATLGSIEEGIGAASGDAEGVADGMRAAGEAARAQLEEHTDALVERANAAQARVEAAVAAGVSELASGAEAGAAAVGGMHEEARRGAEAATREAGEITATAEGGRAAVEAYGAEQGAGLEGLGGHVRTKLEVEYRSDVPTGETPKKRRVAVPAVADAEALRADIEGAVGQLKKSRIDAGLEVFTGFLSDGEEGSEPSPTSEDVEMEGEGSGTDRESGGVSSPVRTNSLASSEGADGPQTPRGRPLVERSGNAAPAESAPKTPRELFTPGKPRSGLPRPGSSRLRAPTTRSTRSRPAAE
ncbi:unnamed protein product [Pedinophyceae sp. YPF-701]|nr:unnamed protein product [Pedinophyceae sp. YPF-701]